MVDIGIVMDKVNKIEIMGIKIRISKGRREILIKKIFIIIPNIPINKAVIIDNVSVADTFSIQDFLLSPPIIKSFDVRAINGPEIFPLKDNKAGIISIRIIKLLKGKINRISIIPAKISPIIETISEGNVSLTILPLES